MNLQVMSRLGRSYMYSQDIDCLQRMFYYVLQYPSIALVERVVSGACRTFPTQVQRPDALKIAVGSFVYDSASFLACSIAVLPSY